MRRAVHQKLGRDTHLARSAGVLSKEARHKEGMWTTYIGLSFWVFVYLGPIILFLSSHLTDGPWTLPKMCVQLNESHLRGLWVRIYTYRGVGSPPFWLSRSFPTHVQTGKSSLTSGEATLSLCFSTAQLLPLALSLECLGENKGSVLFFLRNTRCSAQRPHCLLCHNHLIFGHPLLLLPSVFPSIRVFSNESALHIRWSKYWRFSFSISPSNEYSRLIFFQTEWLDLLSPRGSQESSPATQFKNINFSALSLL